MEPVALRRYQHKPMAVIVFQRHPISCKITPSPMEIHRSVVPTAGTYYSAIQKEPTMEADRYEKLTTSQEMMTSSVSDTDTELCIGYCLNNGYCFLVNSEMSCRYFGFKVS